MPSTVIITIPNYTVYHGQTRLQNLQETVTTVANDEALPL